MTAAQSQTTITAYLDDVEIEWEADTATGHTAITAMVPGSNRLRTTVSLLVTNRSVSVNAFVIRRPDENHGAVHQWILRRNQRISPLAYALDHLGDIYLVTRLRHEAVTPDGLDEVFGLIAENSDGAFNPLLELGFRSAIEREWQWRLARGESTRNLEAFAHLAQPDSRQEGPGSSAR